MSVSATSLWKAVPISSLIDGAQTGFASGADVEDGILQVRMNNITTDGALDWSKRRRVPIPAQGVDKVLAKSGDVLFNHTNSPELVGKSAFFSGFDEPVTFSNHFISLRPKASILDGRYLARWLQKHWSEGRFQALCKQWVNQATVSKDTLLGLEVPLPPLEEQSRIATILDQADELRRKRQHALDRLNQLGQAIFIEMFGDPVANPFGLSQCVLGDVVHSASDGPHVSPTYADSGIPFLSTRHVKPGEILWRDLKYLTVEDAEAQWKKCRPQIGDLLYTKGGTTGIAAVVDTENPFAVWVHVALLKTNHAKVEPLWLEAMLNCDFCYRQSQTLTHGIANRDLGLKRMVNIKMYLPSLDDQRKFVERLQVVRVMRSNMRLAEEAGQSFFASLQHRAFSGELTACSLKEAAA